MTVAVCLMSPSRLFGALVLSATLFFLSQLALAQFTQQGAKVVGSLEALSKASQSRCPPTAIPPSWAGRPITRARGQHGPTPAATVSGPSRAESWSVQMEVPNVPKQMASQRLRPPAATSQIEPSQSTQCRDVADEGRGAAARLLHSRPSPRHSSVPRCVIRTTVERRTSF